MTKQEADRALKEKLAVALGRFGTPRSPYVGEIKRALPNGHFWFEGKSKSETFLGEVSAKQVSLWRR